MKPILQRWLRWFSYVAATGAGLLLVGAVTFYFWFPNLAGHKNTVEEFLTAEIGQPVVIQHLNTRWQGLRLLFQARGVRVRGMDDTQSALRLSELRMVVDPLPLLWGTVRLSDLTIGGITFELVRSESGQIEVVEFARPASQTPQGVGALGWWFRQQNVRIENANVVLRDAQTPDRRLHFTNIALSIRREGESSHVTGTAQLPHELGKRVSISGRFNGVPISNYDWSGVVEVAFSGINITELAKIFADTVPWQAQGRLDARLSTSFVNGRPVGGVGGFKATELGIPYLRTGERLIAEQFNSEFSWQRGGQGWRLLLLHPEIDVGRVLKMDQMEIDRMSNVYTFRAESVDLANLVSAIKELEIKLPWQYIVDRVKPAGRIDSAKITIAGDLRKPTDWHFEGDFEGLSWEPYQRFPGLSGVRGKLQLDPKQGRLTMRTGNVELDFPQVLRAPVRFSRVRGNLAWSRDQENWSVHATQLDLANQDIEISDGSVSARLPTTSGKSPYIDARAKFNRLQLASIKKYLPVKVMKPKAVRWGDHAFAGGQANEGKFTLRGRVKDFPFKDDRGGEFRLTAKVRDGVLRFAPNWPAVKDVTADVIFDNEWFRVNAEHGRYMGSVVTKATAVSEELFLKKKPKLLQIDGEIRARVADVTEFLTRGPLIKQKDQMPKMKGSGEGLISLKLDLPLGRLKESTQVSGTYTVKDASVDLVKSGIGLTMLNGRISFTEQVVNGEGLTAQMLDGPVRLDVSSVKPSKPPNFVIDFQGEGNIKGLAPILSNSIVGFLHGERIPWAGRLEVARGHALLSVNSPGTGLRSDLPEPLAKEATERWQVSTDVVFEKNTRDIRFNIADRLLGVLRMRKDGEAADFERGSIGFNKGKQELPQDPGVQIAAATAEFDMDAWIKAWRQGREFANASQQAKDGSSFVDALRKVRLDTRALRFLDRELGEMQIEAHSTDSLDWVTRLRGPAAAGAARARFYRTPDRSPDFRFVLDRLYWPKGLEREDGDQAVDRESPKDYPSLAIDADDFRFGTWRLGRMRLRAAPQGENWNVKSITTEHPALKVSGSGHWYAPTPKQQTELNLVIQSEDSGQALAQLGFPNQVAGGKATLTAKLRWPGNPGRFRLAHLEGEVELEAKKGRFLQIEPGTGRLMGLFNVDAVARRMTLDFTDIYSKGLAFDRINAKARIAQGDLFSEGIYIVGPAAMIEAQGRAGLDQEDYDMELIVAPDVGGNLTLLSALANPAAGAVVFLVQKLFKKQLAKVVHYRYQVNGPWDNPHVVRLLGEPTSDPDSTDDAVGPEDEQIN